MTGKGTFVINGNTRVIVMISKKINIKYFKLDEESYLIKKKNFNSK